METFIHEVFLLKNYGATIISHTQFILIELYFGDKICVSSYSENSVKVITHNFSYVLPRKVHFVPDLSLNSNILALWPYNFSPIPSLLSFI